MFPKCSAVYTCDAARDQAGPLVCIMPMKVLNRCIFDAVNPPSHGWTMRKFLALTAVALMAAPTVASAQLSITSNVANTSVTAFHDPSRTIAVSYNQVGGGTFGQVAGPLRATFNLFGSAITSDVYCVDLLNGLDDGNARLSNITILNSSTTTLGALTRIGQTSGGSAALTTYRKMAWLASQMTVANQANWAGIQGAIWNLESGLPATSVNSNVATWVNLANTTNLSSFNLAGWAVVTQTTTMNGQAGRQELLVPLSVNVVPEPSTYALMATGLIGLVGFARRRRSTV
jgi:hypothetical protein